MADVMTAALLHFPNDTVPEVERETLYESLSAVKDERLVESLHDSLANVGCRDTW